jgi:subtilase family serine protease
MARVPRYSRAGIFAVLTSLFLTACSGSGTAPPVSSPSGSTSSITGNSGTTTTSGSRFIKSVAGSDSTPITYYAHPPRIMTKAVAKSTGILPSTSQCIAAYTIACYAPQQLRTAYNVPSSLDGTGQTIVIVDAFGSPTIQYDLQLFDFIFGLPDTTLNVLYPVGQPPAFDPSNPDVVGWAYETTLDVEWAHSIAPGATIDLVVAPTDVGRPLDQAQAYAVRNHLGSVMSLSFGTPEASISGLSANIQLIGSDITYAIAAAQGMTVVAGGGDWGATNGAILSSNGFYPTPNAVYPASDPLVTAVGGTNLIADPNTGAYQSEDVWNDSIAAQCPPFSNGCDLGVAGATGGAPSDLFIAPPYQAEVSHQRTRTTNDVTYNAGPYTAVYIIDTFDVPPGYFEYGLFGGTSAGTPQWAAIAALANQALGRGRTVGFMNPKLYAIASNRSEYTSDFHDITFGSNSWGGPGFSAGPGYDIPSGLGSPNVANLVRDLAASTRGRR